ARPPRRCVDATADARQFALGAARDVDRPDALFFARRGERDLLVVGRPRRHVVVGGGFGDLLQLAAADVERPDVVVAAERAAAVGGEGDARAVVRPGRLTVVERSPRQLVLIRSVRRNRPDVVAAIAI